MKKVFITILVLFLVSGAGIAYFLKQRQEKVEYSFATVKRGTLIQTVSETGTVKARSELKLNFLQTGKIAKIYVQVGDKVKAGQALAELDYSSLSNQKKEAEANLMVAKANLAKLLAGASKHDIAVAQANVEQAKTAYEVALRDLEKTKKVAEENIKQAQDNLNDLTSNDSDSLTSLEQAVESAKVNLNNIKATYQKVINNKRESAFTAMEAQLSAANTALDYINTILEDDDAENTLSAKNYAYLISLNQKYSTALSLLESANADYSKANIVNSDNNAVRTAMESIINALRQTFSALNQCYLVLENSVTSSSFSQTQLDTYKSNINTQITTINSGISSLESSDQALADAILNYNTNVSTAENNLAQAQAALDDAITKAKNILESAKVTGEQQIVANEAKVDTAQESLKVAQAQLLKVKAPARQEDINLAQAQVDQAKAALNVIQTHIDNSIIKAPIDGVITKVNYEVGEQSSMAEPIILMLGENNLEVEVDISEADIAKVKVGNKVEITLDAFGDDVKFYGRVRFIEPAETIIQDVIYYKTKIDFTKIPDGYKHRIKPGMTANIIITTAQANNALIIPARAVIEKENGDKIVRILVNKKIQEKKVETGLSGDDGLIEIAKGLNEGEKVILHISKK